VRIWSFLELFVAFIIFARFWFAADADIKRLHVKNAGWKLVPLAEGEDAPLFLRIRGFKLVKHEQRVLEFPAPGTYVVDEA
jgi:hypothetical protein